jgi:hypothetical protein
LCGARSRTHAHGGTRVAVALNCADGAHLSCAPHSAAAAVAISHHCTSALSAPAGLRPAAAQEGKTPMDVAKDDATRTALTTVPADVAALLSRLALSAYGPALVDKLGVAFCADLALLTEADLEKEMPAMRVAERRRLLHAAAVAAPAAPPHAPV